MTYNDQILLTLDTLWRLAAIEGIRIVLWFGAAWIFFGLPLLALVYVFVRRGAHASR